MNRKIAYIMSRFPHLPETFILREMTELENHGWQVDLFPLILQDQPVIHAEAKPWLSRARRLPFVSPRIVAMNGLALARQPLVYGRVLGRALWENGTSPNFLPRAIALFPKAVYAARLMKQAGVAHIHAHYATHPALVAWLIHRLTGISYSVTVHAHDIFVRQEMLATKLREAAFVAAISVFNREYLAGLVGPWIKAKTHIVHCGITPASYQVRAAPPPPGEQLEILCIGSLQLYKGHTYLLQACARLRERGLPFHCRIIGEGEERSAMERQIDDLDLAKHVELLGAQPQEKVAHLLSTAHCYVQPSIITPNGKMEGIPVALMEALACALPVVATRLSGIPELVRPGETGYLAPPADAAALAEALFSIYQDPAEAYRLGQAGRRLVLKEFELQTNVKNLSALFEQTVRTGPPVTFAGPQTAMIKN